MVKILYFKKVFWLAITLLVITSLSLGGHISAKQLEIKAEDVERIKTALGMAQTVATMADIIINNKDLATVLNTIISGSKTGVDITYGLVVLGTLNEMDLVDLVVSGRYQNEARGYFNSVLKQTTNLTSYWKNTSQNIFSLIRKGGAVTPTTGLAMESVAILEKTMSIIVSANVWLQTETYNGMWRYFQDRMNGDTHKEAWYFAEGEMGYVPEKEKDIKTSDGWRSASYGERRILQLEPQFAEMYENWKPYVTPFGISDEYKKQVKEELSGAIVAAVQTNTVAAKKFEPSFVDRLYSQFEKLKNEVAALISQINPFKAGIILNLPSGPEIIEHAMPLDEMFEAGPPSLESLSITEPLPIITEVKMLEAGPPSLEQMPVVATTTPESMASTTEPATLPEPPPELTPKPAPTPGPMLCDKRADDLPRRYRVFINEVAWMGTINSPNDEWIELRNIWGIPVKLNGWQLLDKDQQIKIIFGEDDVIPADGYYLLERTNDDSAPDAKANLIYTGALSNTDEALYLFDDQCNIEDEILANPDWPAGDNSLKKSMTRLDDLNWFTAVNTTPSGENGPQPSIRPAASISTPPPTSTSASLQIIVTETYIGSEDNQKDDFVELYNPNSETIDLTDWYLQRKTDGAEDFSSYVPHGLLPGKTIGTQDYFLIANASSTFATSADVITVYPLTENNTLVLKNNQQEIISQVSTNNPAIGKSYGRKWSSTTLNYTEDFEAQVPTPRAQNQNSAAELSYTILSGGITFSEDSTLGLLGSPYISDGPIHVLPGVTLSIEPGVIIKFQHGSSRTPYAELNVEGSLSAIGSESQKIVFTSYKDDEYGGDTNNDGATTQPVAGDWDWVYFKDSISNLQNVIVRYGGKLHSSCCGEFPSYTYGTIYVDGGQLTISSSTVEKSETLGLWIKNSINSLITSSEFKNINTSWPKPAAIYIENGSSTISNSTFHDNNIGVLVENYASPTIENNTFESNQIPIQISTLLPIIFDNTAQNNSLDGILVSGLGFSNTINQIDWQKADLPYILENNTTISSGQTLNIKPGVVIKLKNGGRIYVDGTLRAEGTENEKIVFTSLSQTSPGAWNFIKFSASSIDSVLDNVVVSYGGWYNVFQGGTDAKSGAIKTQSDSLIIKNSLFENNLFAGLQIANATTTIESTTFNKNENGIYVENSDGSCPNLSSVIFGIDENANSVDIYPSNCFSP